MHGPFLKGNSSSPSDSNLFLGVQLATGMAHCHDGAIAGYRVLHRDVKPNNVGFMPDQTGTKPGFGRLVLFDFGLSYLWKRNYTWSHEGKAEREEMRTLTGECGSLRYMAPEVCNSRSYNHLCEVFSFGSVMWEMCAHRKPFLALDEYNFRQAVDAGCRPKIDSKWPKKLRALFNDCWKHNPIERPEMKGDPLAMPKATTTICPLAMPKTTRRGPPLQDIWRNATTTHPYCRT